MHHLNLLKVVLFHLAILQIDESYFRQGLAILYRVEVKLSCLVFLKKI